MNSRLRSQTLCRRYLLPKSTQTLLNRVTQAAQPETAPAARRVSTARFVYRDAQTRATAAPSSSALPASTCAW